MESLVLPGKVQRRVRCGSLQEGQVGSVEEKTALVSRLDGGAEDSWQSGEHDDGLARAKLAVFVSGGGSNFRAIHAGCKKNAIHGDVAFVVSDKPGSVLSLCRCFMELKWMGAPSLSALRPLIVAAGCWSIHVDYNMEYMFYLSLMSLAWFLLWNSGCKGVEYAMDNNIPVLAYPKGKNAPEGISPTELVENLRWIYESISLVCLVWLWWYVSFVSAYITVQQKNKLGLFLGFLYDVGVVGIFRPSIVLDRGISCN
jgi:hypothetical protein